MPQAFVDLEEIVVANIQRVETDQLLIMELQKNYHYIGRRMQRLGTLLEHLGEDEAAERALQDVSQLQAEKEAAESKAAEEAEELDDADQGVVLLVPAPALVKPREGAEHGRDHRDDHVRLIHEKVRGLELDGSWGALEERHALPCH